MCGVRDGLLVVLGMLQSGYALIVAMNCVHARWGKRAWKPLFYKPNPWSVYFSDRSCIKSSCTDLRTVSS